MTPVREGGRDAGRDETRGTRQTGRRAQSDGGQSRTNAVRNDQADFAASQGGPAKAGSAPADAAPPRRAVAPAR